MRLVSTLALIASLSVPVAALADTINVTGTGVNVSAGSNDPNYTVSGPDVSLQQAVTINPNPGWGAQPAFNPAPGAANWDNPGGDGSTSYDGGDFTFTTTFDLTGELANTASLSGGMAADNAVTVFLNGHQGATAAYGPPYGFSQFTSWSFNSGFVSGVNTLTFVVTNGNGGSDTNGPMGLIVKIDSNSVSPVPEPASIALLGTGVMTLAGFARRSRR
jgi:hypothetical protein